MDRVTTFLDQVTIFLDHLTIFLDQLTTFLDQVTTFLTQVFATNPEDGFHGRLVKAGEGSPGVGRLKLSRGDVGLLPCACLRVRAPVGNECLFRLV